jgi:hypothetical protein
LFAISLEKHKNHPKWDSGDFRGIKTVSNTSVGSVGQHFIQSMCTAYGIESTPPTKKMSWDLDINGTKFEIKTATEDINGGFQFNHFRLHRPYEAVLCLGVAPDELYFNAWSKQDVVMGLAGVLVSMEKSANASYKLSKKKNNLHNIVYFEEVILALIKRIQEEKKRSKDFNDEMKVLTK